MLYDATDTALLSRLWLLVNKFFHAPWRVRPAAIRMIPMIFFGNTIKRCITTSATVCFPDRKKKAESSTRNSWGLILSASKDRRLLLYRHTALNLTATPDRSAAS
jgi:hypothetical protein